jgi:hypothetical protein
MCAAEREAWMKAREDLMRMWREDPCARVSVIVHTLDAADQHVEGVESCGLSVARAFRLTNTIAASGLAQDVLNVLEEPWVARVELDQTITTMGVDSNPGDKAVERKDDQWMKAS